jgi:hypothetical protein
MHTAGAAYGYPARPAGQVRGLPLKRSPSRGHPTRCCPAGAHRQSAGVSAASCTRNAGLAVRSPACAHRRQLTAVMPGYCNTALSRRPRCRSGQRRGAAELGRLASGAVTPGVPGEQAARQAKIAATAGRSNDEVQSAIARKGSLAAVRSSVPRPPSRSSAATAGLQRGPGPRGRPSCSRSPQFRGAYRPPACCTCLAVMPRLLAYCLGDGS